MAVMSATSPSGTLARNPGPSWGMKFLRLADRFLPEAIYRPIRFLGTGVAVLAMPVQRRHSRAYLARILKNPPSILDLWRHFFAFEETLMLKLRVANGLPHTATYAPGSTDFEAWLAERGPALLGTFHVGTSDLLGFQLGGVHHRKIHLVRQRMGNAHDTEKLAALYGRWVKFVWVNEPGDLLFALKDAASIPDGIIAIQCDRIETSARVETFEFLGERRVFPFAVYHLALIFDRPVLLSVGFADGPTSSVLHTSPRFTALPGESRAATLARARVHFQDFLKKLESLLRANPYQWFNYTPLNPVAAP
jgi:predicted LPLAT superfamily acyltransferase